MNFDECELAILRIAVDKAGEKIKKRIANSQDIIEIIKIVENFIKRKNLICYGGTAINNILPKTEQFYNKDGVVLVRINPAFYRPAEVDLLLGDPTKSKDELGWTPAISFFSLVKEMVENDINSL
jgi:GDP-D-mannose dehydratase